ncbi:MAG: ribosomal-protein-alanine N-acetyltransferase [Candidatus Azotimanducaceae bacterium]|jgi:ribosomal-protein-alanine N-acetyltransferase
MIVAESERLILRKLKVSDSAFILEIYNTDGFLRFIGDRNIRSLEDAQTFLVESPLKMYCEHGISLYRVELKSNGEPVGLCGLINRDSSVDIDIGYAFLPAFCGKGYAIEAARVTLDFARNTLKVNRVVAITQTDNKTSIALLLKLGMTREGDYTDPASKEDVKIDRYGITLSPDPPK